MATKHVDQVRQDLKALSGEQFQEIRQAFYKATDGLGALRNALREQSPTHSGLKAELAFAVAAELAMQESVLGELV